MRCGRSSAFGEWENTRQSPNASRGRAGSADVKLSETASLAVPALFAVDDSW